MAILGNKVKLEFKALGKSIEWPATPKITQSVQVNYQTWELQHTNYQPSAFGNRATPEIVISGPWFSRDTAEAQRTLEAIHTLRTATMMYYGRNDSKKGTPPPIGRFTAYGLYNNTPVVVKSFQYDFPNDVDYVTAGGPTKTDNQSGNSQAGAGSASDAQAVPVLFDMSVTLIVQMNPIEVVKNFELDKFKSGSLLGEGYI